MKLVSIQEKVNKCRSLQPHDLSNWERGFRETLERAALADKVSLLTDSQLAILDTLYERHFG